MKTIVTIALIVEIVCVLTAIVWIVKELKYIKKQYENNIHAKDN